MKSRRKIRRKGRGEWKQRGEKGEERREKEKEEEGEEQVRGGERTPRPPTTNPGILLATEVSPRPVSSPLDASYYCILLSLSSFPSSSASSSSRPGEASLSILQGRGMRGTNEKSEK